MRAPRRSAAARFTGSRGPSRSRTRRTTCSRPRCKTQTRSASSGRSTASGRASPSAGEEGVSRGEGLFARMQNIPLNAFDLAVFVIYMVVTVALGFWVAGKNRKTARGYFLGDKKLPWYVVATSMIAADISSDDLIANAGVAYKFGIMPAAGSWNAWIIYTLLIWVFLPYYVRSGIYTMPQFLEKRYNSTCRYIFAVALVVGYVGAILGGTLYAGGLALQGMLAMDLTWAIIFFGVTTGAYTIYGGLTSAAWTDFVQVALLLTAGILIPVLGLYRVGGLEHLMHEHPQKFQVYLPPTHERFPVTGVFTGFLTVGIWYSCTSQHMVQRVLGAKDEWHARMGVVGAGFLRIVTPIFFVVPGIIAFKMFPNLPRQDMAYLELVKELIPTGLRGLILAGMAAALMSNVSSVLNSASTIMTMDLYGKVVRPQASERELVKFGRWSGVVILFVSMLVAYYYSKQGESLYVQLQRVFFFIAPPFAVVFLVGLLWKRATSAAALWTIGL